MSLVEEAIERFRKGERYQPPPTGFIADGRLLEAELAPFGPALRQESPEVREQIVNLLADAGRRADPLYELGGQLIRQPLILSMFVNDGLGRNDLGHEAALQALQQWAPAEQLKTYEEKLTADLKDHPSLTGFLLIAKVKPPAAVVFRMMLTASSDNDTKEKGKRQWSKELNFRVAAAALGDIEIEKEYTQPFLATRDPLEKARLAGILGWIGTETALRILAGELRTDLVIDRPRVMKRSVRLDVLEALSYNFPDQPALYESQINSDAGYERAERFCEERFGVTWDRPRPPYLKIMGYPILR